MGAPKACNMNYTEPRIFHAETLEKRSYITFKIDGNRVREYTGIAINVQLSPNKATSIAERNYLLELLRSHYQLALESGNYNPVAKKPKCTNTEEPKLGELEHTLRLAIGSKKRQNLAPRYIKHLEKLMYDFLDY